MEGPITAPWDEGSLQRDGNGCAVSLVRGGAAVLGWGKCAKHSNDNPERSHCRSHRAGPNQNFSKRTAAAHQGAVEGVGAGGQHLAEQLRMGSERVCLENTQCLEHLEIWQQFQKLQTGLSDFL